MKHRVKPLCLLLSCFLISAVSVAAPPAFKLPPTPVTVVKVKQQRWQPKIKATGTLVASQGVTLKPEVPGLITKIYVKSGQTVKAGAPLIALNQEVLKAQLASDQAQLQSAKSSYARIKQLRKTNTASAAQYDEVLATLKTQQAIVKKDQALLAQTLIKAPFHGRLGIRKVNLGDYVTAGQALIDLETLDPIYVDFSVPEVYLDLLNPQQKISVRSSAYPSKVYNGTVHAQSVKINPDTRSLTLRAQIANPEKRLLPGMFVEVTLLAGTTQTVLTVPQTAIVYSANQTFVYKALKGNAVKTTILLGPRLNGSVVVKHGLQRGETVVVSGQLKLHDGAPILAQ